MKFPKKQQNYWVSLSDIMTGLMVIFLFISISYMLQIKKEQDKIEDFVKDYIQTKMDLYEELRLEFEDDFKPENWNVLLDRDLSIKFLNERVLFDYNRADIRPEFRRILKEFFPRYLDILWKDRYKNKIAEVRIEGHTDRHGDYFYNVNLSQRRTKNVLEYLMTDCLENYHELNIMEQEDLRFWFTANGFSSGRTLDDYRALTYYSRNPPNDEFSRRVEFRIITASEKVIESMKQEIENR